MMVVVLYAMAFVVGPALFLILGRRQGRRWPLALGASICAALSYALRSDLRVTLAPDPAPLFASVALIWLAWIFVLSMVMRGVLATRPTRTLRRISRAVLAMGTTVPWFGFATARYLAAP